VKGQRKVLFIILTIILMTAAGCSNRSQDQDNKGREKTKSHIDYKIVEAKSLHVSQILGIGYPGNDNALYTATPKGLIMYKSGKWYTTNTNLHDYIGFQAINSGFITSGHPEKKSSYKDPLGLVRSENKGETLQEIAFSGEENFHFTAASFYGNGLYIINEQQDDHLDLGINYSTDSGKSWKKSALAGFQANSYGMMAVHPKDGNIMAMATRTGIYYSTNNGNDMKPITSPIMVTALTFWGDSILYSSVEEKNILLKTVNPISGAEKSITIPFLDYDNPITYVAANPKNTNQMAFSTYKNDLYESIDGGKTWSAYLKDGKQVLE